MADQQPGEFFTQGNGPKYDYSAVAAAEILNLLDPKQPKAILFGRILFVILSAMYQADEALNDGRWEPSDN